MMFAERSIRVWGDAGRCLICLTESFDKRGDTASGQAASQRNRVSSATSRSSVPSYSLYTRIWGS